MVAAAAGRVLNGCDTATKVSRAMTAALTLPRSALVAMLALGLSAPLSAKQLYEYVDANGIRHFTDTPPQTDAPVKATRIQVDNKPLVRLETRDVDGRSGRIIVHNLSAGPVEVDVELREAVNVDADPPLPRRFVLGHAGEHALAVVSTRDRSKDAAFQVSVNAVPGDPRSQPDPLVHYRLPFPAGTRYLVSQGFGGGYSHTDEQNFHAVDLGVAEGTPILAARDGLVVEVERDFYESGADRSRFAARANMVRVLHEDGTMAVYAHLAYESTLVTPGSVVLAGQRIGSAGATGFATGPHLHFVVQRNAGMRLVSIPFRFSEADGAPYTPERSRGWLRVP